MIVHLDGRRRHIANVINKLQHATAGFPLLMLGVEKLGQGEDVAVAAAEVAIAVVVLVTFVIEVRAAVRHTKHPEHQHHPKVGWFDLAAGIMLIYEAFHGAHHKPGYLRPQFFAGLATLMLGLLHHRLGTAAQKRRYFRIDDDGVAYRMVLKSWSIPWKELDSVEVTEKLAVFARTDGRRHKVHLGRLLDPDAVRRAIAEHPESAKMLKS